MKKFLIKNANIVSGGEEKGFFDLLISNGKIEEILSLGSKLDLPAIDVGFDFVTSGFVDLHMHGAQGHDFLESTTESTRAIAKYCLRQGTTSVSPTLMSASLATISAALVSLEKHCTACDECNLLKVHLEGPFFTEKNAGAQDKRFLLGWDSETKSFFENFDNIGRVSVAPDLNGAKDLCDFFFSKKVQISMGHDDAIDPQIYQCISAGANSITHFFNCTSTTSRRGTAEKFLGLREVGLLEKDLVVEVIADRHHIPDKLFKMIYQVKGFEKICLVSDSIFAAGFDNGEQHLSDKESGRAILVQDGVAVLKDLDIVAGSVTPLSKMVKNVVEFCGVPVSKAVYMANEVPCKLMNLHNKGKIEKGFDADIVVLDKNADLKMVMCRGEMVKT